MLYALEKIVFVGEPTERLVPWNLELILSHIPKTTILIYFIIFIFISATCHRHNGARPEDCDDELVIDAPI
jgi:hypothetical protein